VPNANITATDIPTTNSASTKLSTPHSHTLPRSRHLSQLSYFAETLSPEQGEEAAKDTKGAPGIWLAPRCNLVPKLCLGTVASETLFRGHMLPAKRSFAIVRSQTEFGNEFGNEEKDTKGSLWQRRCLL
jgi:hypothetical protein